LRNEISDFRALVERCALATGPLMGDEPNPGATAPICKDATIELIDLLREQLMYGHGGH